MKSVQLFSWWFCRFLSLNPKDRTSMWSSKVRTYSAFWQSVVSILIDCFFSFFVLVCFSDWSVWLACFLLFILVDFLNLLILPLTSAALPLNELSFSAKIPEKSWVTHQWSDSGHLKISHRRIFCRKNRDNLNLRTRHSCQTLVCRTVVECGIVKLKLRIGRFLVFSSIF